MKTTVRILKGLYMGLMFILFIALILLPPVLIVPPLMIERWIRRREVYRMQAVNRFGFGIWLFFLRLGNLIKKLPTTGRPCGVPCVIVANHPGLFDILFLICEIPDLTLMYKRSLGWKLGLKPVFTLSGYIPSPEYSSMSAATGNLGEAIARLGAGQKYLLFPEGTRSPMGGLQRFRRGAFRVAAIAKVPVQPVLIRNTPPFISKGDKWYLPPYECSTIRFEFLDPVQPPGPGEEDACARKLEARFRSMLQLSPSTSQHSDGVEKR
jgi:1-acyl-sn-glycerol-3-phosphate acyltransferase